MYNFFYKFQICIFSLVSLTYLSSSADVISDQKQKILGMPLIADEISFVQSENTRTRTYLDSLDVDFAKKLQARASELVAKNAQIRVNLYGDDHWIKDGSLIKEGQASEEVVIPATILPVDSKLVAYRYSPDQTKIAFAYSFFGSDWQTWQIYDLNKKAISSVDGEYTFKGFGGPGLTWTPNSKMVLYPSDSLIQDDFAGLRNPQIRLHTIGQSNSMDRVIFTDSEKQPSSRWAAVPVSNSHAVVFRVQGAAVIPVAAYKVDLFSGQVIPLIERNKFLGNTPGMGIVGVRNGVAYFRSASVGNNYGILSVDVSKNKVQKPKILVPHDNSRSLYQAILIGDKIIAQYINKDLSLLFKMYNLNGVVVAQMSPSDFGFTNFGHPSLPLAEGDETSSLAYFTFSSVSLPSKTFRADVLNNRFEFLPDTGTVPFDGKKIIETWVNYSSHDGEKIPMAIYRRADQLGQKAKFAYLYSYGFIGVPNLPQWNRKFQLALDMGAIVALPMIRGGGEYGAKSQLDGTNNRENTFQDLVFASRWLKSKEDIDNKRVAVVGRSFGGLTGAVHYVHNQNEFDLISSIVPVTDWNAHFFGTGWWMGDDFGIVRDSNGFTDEKNIQKLASEVSKWNPSENIYKLKGKKLIPAIFFSGQFDTNTTPHQTFRFIEKIRSETPTAPIYMFQHANGGHGARAELVDEFLFISKEFGLKEILPIR